MGVFSTGTDIAAILCLGVGFGLGLGGLNNSRISRTS